MLARCQAGWRRQLESFGHERAGDQACLGDLGSEPGLPQRHEHRLPEGGGEIVYMHAALLHKKTHALKFVIHVIMPACCTTVRRLQPCIAC